jgi:fructosamine-3-kinase
MEPPTAMEQPTGLDGATALHGATALDPATATRLTRLLGRDLAAARSLGGQHGIRHYRLQLADGRIAFAKLLNRQPAGNGLVPTSAARRAAAEQATADEDPGGFAAEAAGLLWLAAADAVPVPDVLACDSGCLIIEWVDDGRPSPAAAARFGRELARLHAVGASRFGAPWPGVIAGLPLPDHEADSWPDWYVVSRVLPFARTARDAGTLTGAGVALIESACARLPELAGPAEPPSRIHGDCWTGNVLWSGGRGWLIDPAAHGGHRETDLAMLALFGAPYLNQILSAYEEEVPLADGWRDRVPLHQLHPLLVHACLFGGAYADAALGAARAVLAL